MDIRGWIARKLLNLAHAVDPECKLMFDAIRGWRFERKWKQPVMGGSGPLDGRSDSGAASTTTASKGKE